MSSVAKNLGSLHIFIAINKIETNFRSCFLVRRDAAGLRASDIVSGKKY